MIKLDAIVALLMGVFFAALLFGELAWYHG